MPVYKRRLPGQPGMDLSDLAGMPLEAPAAIAGAMGKAAKLAPEALMDAHDILGRTMQLGKRLVRLSSADPATNKAIVHTDMGERIATPLDDFLKKVTEYLGPTDPFPEGATLSQPGVRAPGGEFGPRGGVSPLKRKIPPTATR